MKSILLIFGLVFCTPSIICVDEYFDREDKYQRMEAILDYAYSNAVSDTIKISIRYEDNQGRIVEYSVE